jgi:hypothetical protein
MLIVVYEPCEFCERIEGEEVDICGEPGGVPLGPVERCPDCGRWSCPDCQHERDCCAMEGGPCST